MIPIADVTPDVPRPLPSCRMPRTDEISEEGFGYFRGTWFIGRARIADAQEVVREEAAILDWLDRASPTPDHFECLASAIEGADLEGLPDTLRSEAVLAGIGDFIREDDATPLDGLEVGVAGLVYALSAIGCLTAASCRSHADDNSWADYPVIFFAAPAWKLEILAPMISEECCGLEEGGERDLLVVYAASVRETHRLAERLLKERAQFRRARGGGRIAESRDAGHSQLRLFDTG